MNPASNSSRFLRCVAWTAGTLSLALGSACWGQPVVAGEAEDRLKSLVVMIQGKLAGSDTIGAGIIVGVRGDRLYIVTANHVVRQGTQEEAQDLRVLFRWLPGESAPARLLTDVDHGLDLAVLSVTNLKAISLPKLPFDRLGDTTALKRTAPVYSVGYPNGRPWYSRVTPDAISEASTDLLKFESLFLAPGHSGGALVNERWELVGVIRSDQPPDGEAVRIDRILEKLRQWNYPVNLTTTAPSPGAKVEIRTFEAQRVPRGGPTLCWSVLNARSARIDPDLGDLDPRTLEKGCREVRPGATTIYTLTATGADGRTESRQVTVTVARFEVTRVAASVSPQSHVGPCPKAFTFTGEITATAPGTVAYRWERNDTVVGREEIILFKGSGTLSVPPYVWSIGRPEKSYDRSLSLSVRLRVLTPSPLVSDPAGATLVCRN